MPRYARAHSLLLGATVLVGAGLVASACSSTGGNAAAHGTDPPTTMDMGADDESPDDRRVRLDAGVDARLDAGSDPAVAIAGDLAKARVATARYATDLDAAKADGYRIITPMMTDMGYHFLNPSVQGFDVEKPPILVYERAGDAWQLAALEWIFPEQPATPPLEGASYGSFPRRLPLRRRHLRVRPTPRPSARRPAPRPARRSSSGTRRSSRCTSGSGTRTPTACSPSMNPLIGPFDTPAPTLRPGHAV